MKIGVYRNFATISLGLFVAITTRSVSAQVDAAAARQAFDDARALVTQGKYEEACPRFEQSYTRDPGIGTLFNWADCLQRLGKTASAWAKFRDVADEAARKRQTERAKIAERRAAELLPLLSKIVVTIDAVDDGLEVYRDGYPILLSDRGKPVILDPGEHQIEAKAKGKRTWVRRVVVPAGGQTIEVTVPSLAPDPSALPEAPLTNKTRRDALSTDKTRNDVPSTVTLVDAPVEPRRDSESVTSRQRTLSYVVGGVGLVGVTVGTVFVLRVRSKNDRADKICPTGVACSPEDIDRFDATIGEAKSARNLAVAGFGVGGAALITGLILYVTAPTPEPTAWRISPPVDGRRTGAVPKPKPDGFRLSPTVDVGYLGLNVGGTL